MTMRKRDDLMTQYVEDLKNKCGMTALHGVADQGNNRLLTRNL